MNPSNSPQKGGRSSVSESDVLVVAAGKIAVADYLRHQAYVCQPHRSFRPVQRIGFYRNGQIEPFFPSVRDRRMDVEFTTENASRLRAQGGTQAEVGDLIDRMLQDPADPRVNGHSYQVFLLTSEHDPQTLRLAGPILHRVLGHGTAWVQSTRYTTEEKLRGNPATTAELA